MEPYQTNCSNSFNSWKELARWLLTDIPLEELTEQEYDRSWGLKLTPLIGAIFRHSHFLTRRRPPNVTQKRGYMRLFRRFLTSWLEDVQSAGIDLAAYGKKELELFVRDHQVLALRWCTLDIGPKSDGYPLSGPRLVSFTYGPEPEDWELIWDPDTEEFAGDFWELVEDRPLPVPGAWGKIGDGHGLVFSSRHVSLYIELLYQFILTGELSQQI